jgi:FAD/FMN-containing dehydrogenase
MRKLRKNNTGYDIKQCFVGSEGTLGIVGVRRRAAAVAGVVALRNNSDAVVRRQPHDVGDLAEMDLPVMLDFPAPHLRAYARETVIAEKFQAMVMLGRANSRMKSFYDIWVLSRASEFTGDRLPRAIAATFARRDTEVPPELPDALTHAFATDATKIQQGNAFAMDVAFQPGTLADVVQDLVAFLMPHAEKARHLS